jgi:NAD(P)-dependent dehydrogenase (short-subunit alcohol dehydrogenase family)
MRSGRRTAIVTGGARGIGAAAALALARRGRNVLIHYHSLADPALELKARIAAEGGVAEVQGGDLRDKEQAAALVARAFELWGDASIICNNAGVNAHRPFLEIAPEEWRAIIDGNLLPCFLVTQAALPHMLAAGWGRVINIASVAAYTDRISSGSGAHYAAAKGGIAAFGRFLARTYAADGITVNTVAPGAVETERSIGLRTAEELEVRARRVPIGRMGLPFEIAETVAFLASEEAGFITGQTIHANGGAYFGQ